MSIKLANIVEGMNSTNCKERFKKEHDMSFASALISLHSGYKIRRKHWTGYWQLEDGEVFIYTYDGKKLNIRASENIMYTISNMACDDWEIADTYGETREV